MTPSYPSANAKILEARWQPISREGDTLTAGADAENHSAPIEAYDSTRGVCNELARFAMNRSAVMAAYDSMFPQSGVPQARSRRSARPEASARRGWVLRLFGALRGRKPG
jgi:hypothetical protein